MGAGCDDVAATRAALEAKGVEFAGDTLTPASATWPSFRTRTATTSCSTTATPRTPDARNALLHAQCRSLYGRLACSASDCSSLARYACARIRRSIRRYPAQRANLLLLLFARRDTSQRTCHS